MKLNELVERSWVVLFGGAGREQNVERILNEGVTIDVIVVPECPNKKLANSISHLKSLNIEVVYCNKANVATVLSHWQDRVLFSIGFPYIVPKSVFDIFPMRFNIHPTLLPKYKGPTTGAYILINNEPFSGSTIHVLDEGVDTGDIACQNSIPVDDFDTVVSLQRKVYASEPSLIALFIRDCNSIELLPQNSVQNDAYLKKRTPDDSVVDPNKSLLALFDSIRACDPENYPAFFIHKGQKVCIKLWRPEKEENEKDMI